MSNSLFLQKTLKIKLILTLICISAPMAVAEQASSSRLNKVERLGQHVMPFDLNQTLHIFSKTDQGGIQQVISKNSSNNLQIKLIREHLNKIAKEFKQGNFIDPTKIHGKNMPGLNALKMAKTNEISIKYQTLTNGAEIIYSTDNPALIRAIHQWFEAQLSDHARHAIKGHPHHLMHNK